MKKLKIWKKPIESNIIRNSSRISMKISLNEYFGKFLTFLKILKEALMNILDIIAKKRDKKELLKEETEYFVKEYTNGNITDYQAAALVMAIYINGMTIEETTNLTLAMAHSGDVLDLSEFGIVVDKHSSRRCRR